MTYCTKCGKPTNNGIMCEDCMILDSPWLFAMKSKEDDLVEQIEKLKSENAALCERLEKAVVFPIKFGDKIYTINFQKPKAQWSVHCGVVKTISVTQTPDKTQFVFRVKIKYRDAREYVLGKSAFLSKEAAEARLAELKGESHEQ